MSASLTIPGGSDTFSFVTASTDQGFILDQAAIEEERLETPGVDGVRWRSIGLKHGQFTVTTVTVCASFTDAVITAKTYMKSRGKNCTFNISAGSVSYVFSNLHVEAVSPRPAAGQVAGGGASSGNQAHILTTWVFVPTSFTAADSVSA